MAVFFKGTNASAGRLIGVVTVLVALFLVSDGFVTGGGIMAIAGAVLYRLESGYNSALYSFAIRIGFLAMIFFSLMFIVG